MNATDHPILLVEDEPAIADVVAYALRRVGFAVEHAPTLAQARRVLDAGGVRALVLDLGLPDGDGVGFCRALRESSSVPVLMLTCRDRETDRVLGLEMGADDYVVKPFSPRELVARVRSLLRRAEGGTGGGEERAASVRLGRVAVSVGAHRVSLGDAVIALTPAETRLLAALVEAPARVLSRAQLLDHASGRDALEVTERTIDSHVKAIRRKFAVAEAGADPIETVHGVGYRARCLE